MPKNIFFPRAFTGDDRVSELQYEPWSRPSDPREKSSRNRYYSIAEISSTVNHEEVEYIVICRHINKHEQSTPPLLGLALLPVRHLRQENTMTADASVSSGIFNSRLVKGFSSFIDIEGAHDRLLKGDHALAEDIDTILKKLHEQDRY